MTTRSNERKSTKREALFALLGTFGLLAGFAFTANAQDAPKAKDVGAPREALAVSGYTRPGNVDDRYVSKDGEILPAAFKGADVKKFKVMGATVYFAVFKNTGLIEGDTFGTGKPNFDKNFSAGRSELYPNSPRYDSQAKYLYLYQVVNDRGLDKIRDDGEIGLAIDSKPKATTETIASFGLKLHVDPRYITSWGHFRDSAFAAKVVDLTGFEKEKAAKEQQIRLAFSFLPPINFNLPEKAFTHRAKSYMLGDRLENEFGVDSSTVGLNASVSFQALQNTKSDFIGLVSTKTLLNDATTKGLEPNIVQLMYMGSDERDLVVENGDDRVTRAIFYAKWSQKDGDKEVGRINPGNRSVVFGFTTDLPPTEAPVRINSVDGDKIVNLASYFSDTGRGQGGDIGLVAAGAEGAALGLALGTALGQAPTPTPPVAAGFSGITGSVGVGGSSTSGMGGAAIPGFSGSYSRPGGGIGGGGGSGQSGTGQSQGQGQQQAGSQSINFSNSQSQQQAQLQAQLQLQLQQQSQNNGNNCGCHHHGHVVPAPASLLLGMFGLPGLYFLRRRKIEA